ncbi:hypothetical protein EON64_16510, partial [archaeon]
MRLLTTLCLFSYNESGARSHRLDSYQKGALCPLRLRQESKCAPPMNHSTRSYLHLLLASLTFYSYTNRAIKQIKGSKHNALSKNTCCEARGTSPDCSQEKLQMNAARPGLSSSKKSSDHTQVTLNLVYLPLGSPKEAEDRSDENERSPIGTGVFHDSHFENSNENKSSLAACYLAMANTIMGAGTLGLPFAVSNTGYVLGSVLLCVSG